MPTSRHLEQIEMTYDPEADALAVNLRPLREAAGAVEVAPGQYVHQDPDGRIVSIEILRASEYLGRTALEQLPDGTQWLTIAEAAKESGLEEGTLRNVIRSGRLPAVKRGRDWLVAMHELWNYQETKSPRGRKAKRKPRRRRAPAATKVDRESKVIPFVRRTPAPMYPMAASGGGTRMASASRGSYVKAGGWASGGGHRMRSSSKSKRGSRRRSRR